MNEQTWDLINQKYQQFRTYRASGIDGSEFDQSFAGFPATVDYREFVLRYGGGLVGTYPIYGLRLAEAMGTIGKQSTAPDITRFFRNREWPAVENWLVFSVDQSGNPVGMAADGTVWISDVAFGQVQKLAETFEDFLLKWALRVKDPNDRE